MPSAPLSFAADIRPLFTDVDVEHMQNYGLDLSSHDDVKQAANILSTVTAGRMLRPAVGGSAGPPNVRNLSPMDGARCRTQRPAGSAAAVRASRDGR